jgi:hypothetical protein
MPETIDAITTDTAILQLLPETEESRHGTHLQWSCDITCPWDTSDSIPSLCCAD